MKLGHARSAYTVVRPRLTTVREAPAPLPLDPRPRRIVRAGGRLALGCVFHGSLLIYGKKLKLKEVWEILTAD